MGKSGLVKFELDRAGVRELLKSQEAMNICKEYAETAQGKLGEGHEVSTREGTNRAIAELHTTTYEAAKNNMENNSLLKAVFG